MSATSTIPRQGLNRPSSLAAELHHRNSGPALKARARAAERADAGWKAAALRGAAAAAQRTDGALRAVYGQGLAVPTPATEFVAQVQAQRQQDAGAFGLVGRVGLSATDGAAHAASGLAACLGASPERTRHAAQRAGYAATAAAVQVSLWVGLLPRALLVGGGALLGLLRAAFARPLRTVQMHPMPCSQSWPATQAQRSSLTAALHRDLTEGTTAQRHASGVSSQFANDAARSSLFLVPSGGSWHAAEDIRPATPGALGDTLQKLTAFCDGDAEWAFRASQYANQNLANSAWSHGLMGGQGLDGRSYRGHKILRCDSAQHDAVSPKHERLEFSRVGDDTLRVQWHRARDLTALHLEGRASPRRLAGSGYSVTLAVDIDRPRADETQPVRLGEAVLRSHLPRPLDA